MSIEVRNLRKAFGGFTALDDVSLHVPGGELVALLGRPDRVRRRCFALSPDWSRPITAPFTSTVRIPLTSR